MNLREDVMLTALNGWIGGLFAPENRDQTVAALLASQPDGPASADVDDAKARLRDAERRLRRFHDAIAAGVDPATVVKEINRAQAERVAAQAQIDSAPARTVLDRAEVYAVIDSLGELGAVLGEAKPERLAQLYQALDVVICDEAEERAAYASARPRVDNACVRRGTCALSTRIAVD